MGAVYWVGNDGNVYTKGAYGEVGVHNEGHAASPAITDGGYGAYDTAGHYKSGQAQRIANPGNPQGGGGSSDSGGGYSSGGSSGPTAEQQAQARADYNALHDTTYGSIGRATSDAGNSYNSGILDYLDQAKVTRNNLNSEYEQNELSRMEGSQGVLDMIGNGVKSGGVIISNEGGGSSSAGEALAKAYGQVGRQQMSKVNNQAAQGLSKIQADENNFQAANQSQLRKTNEDKVSRVNAIVNSAATQLSALNQAAASASLPDRVNVEQEIAKVKDSAMGALSAYDAELSNGIGALGAESTDDVKANATKLLNAGAVPDTMFDYTAQVPAELQNTGDFSSSLPIFTAPQKKATAAATS